jgi:ribosomal protein S18 acetylase RimI-like enzyme
VSGLLEVSGEEGAAAFTRLGEGDVVPPGMEPLAVLRQERVVARCAVSLVPEMVGVEGPTGLIGAVAAEDPADGAVLLRAAAARLEARGARRVLGPMDGSSWMRYRLPLAEPVLTPDPPATFLGEPPAVSGLAEAFAAAGFRTAALYESRIDLDPASPSKRGDERVRRAAAAGLGFRSLEPESFEEELRTLHALSLAAFAENHFYTPLSWEGFRALYEPLRTLIDPSLVIVAEREGSAVGFVFGYPDLLDPRRDPSPRVVLKTLAVHPEARGVGLGSLLTQLLTSAAAARGAPAVIHALMATDNRSVSVSAGRQGQLFRRYALFGRGDLPAT